MENNQHDTAGKVRIPTGFHIHGSERFPIHAARQAGVITLVTALYWGALIVVNQYFGVNGLIMMGVLSIPLPWFIFGRLNRTENHQGKPVPVPSGSHGNRAG